MVAQKVKKAMYIRDVIHGSVFIHPWERSIVESPFFERLRGIKQLGFSEFSFPCATHNRYSHSIGAMFLAGKIFQSIFSQQSFSSTEIYNRYYYLTRIAMALHDIGHGPLSHTVEHFMPDLDKLKLPSWLQEKKARIANHEDYSLKIIIDSPLSILLEKELSRFGIKPTHIACLLKRDIEIKDNFFIDQGINYRKVLSQIISSEIDADRMDYLQRDSYYTGVSYGNFDADWLIEHMEHHVDEDDSAHLCISNRALYTFEDFLLSRYHMFLLVYFHYKSVVYAEMLHRYFASPDCNYSIPANIESYMLCDEAHLLSHLRESKNPWAKKIMQRQPYTLAIEIHSENPQEDASWRKLEEELQSSKKNYFPCFSSGLLSKYFPQEARNIPDAKDSIFVEIDNRYDLKKTMPLHQCSHIFHRYGKKQNIGRIYTEA